MDCAHQTVKAPNAQRATTRPPQPREQVVLVVESTWQPAESSRSALVSPTWDALVAEVAGSPRAKILSEKFILFLIYFLSVMFLLRSPGPRFVSDPSAATQSLTSLRLAYRSHGPALEAE